MQTFPTTNQVGRVYLVLKERLYPKDSNNAKIAGAANFADTGEGFLTEVARNLRLLKETSKLLKATVFQQLTGYQSLPRTNSREW